MKKILTSLSLFAAMISHAQTPSEEQADSSEVATLDSVVIKVIQLPDSITPGKSYGKRVKGKFAWQFFCITLISIYVRPHI